MNQLTQNTIDALIAIYNRKEFVQLLNKIEIHLKEYSASFFLWNILGATKLALTEYQFAKDAFKKAIILIPNNAPCLINLGATYRKTGLKEKAKNAYTRALSLNPTYAEAHNNIGNLLREQSRFEEAEKALTKAITFKPRYPEALLNLGLVCIATGKSWEATELFYSAIRHKPHYEDAYYNLGSVIKELDVSIANQQTRDLLLSLLNQKSYVNVSEIAGPIIKFLKQERLLNNLINSTPVNDIKKSVEAIVTKLSKLDLLLSFMAISPIPDLEFEKLLCAIRSSLLVAIDKTQFAPAILKFQSSLALHYFVNEYISEVSDYEAVALQNLEAKVRNRLSKGLQPHAQAVLCLASYKSLNKYDWCLHLKETAQIKEVMLRQIVEQERELSIRSTLSVFEEIQDHVSRDVREQYEQNPYPRWINTRVPWEPKSVSTIVEEIGIRLTDRTILKNQNPSILIAGCGTGQHALITASRFKDSHILAIDLSLHSLSYAKRKVEEFGVKNIEFMQADILNLTGLNKKFDIIETVGVLHHMDEPEVGWDILVQCLKPGGLIKIGLYSELAHKHITQTREEISKTANGLDESSIKLLRTKLIKSSKDHHQQLRTSFDSYKLSNFRDLVLHVQEHCFNLNQIMEVLPSLNLIFCGFEASDIMHQFKKIYVALDDLIDLNKWATFEKSYPTAFESMY